MVMFSAAICASQAVLTQLPGFDQTPRPVRPLAQAPRARGRTKHSTAATNKTTRQPAIGGGVRNSSTTAATGLAASPGMNADSDFEGLVRAYMADDMPRCSI
jgi:hypothetical protein